MTMRTITLRLTLAALTYSLGVSAVFVWGVVGEVKVSAPDNRLSPVSAVSLKKCEVHDTFMGMEIVPVTYGIKLERIGEKRFYPHSNRLINGGCIVGTKKRGMTFFCPQCRAAESEWERRRGK
jgi:hypothetical protein